jgi:uncharacterized repeat protein (TIGR01451 family)
MRSIFKWQGSGSHGPPGLSPAARCTRTQRNRKQTKSHFFKGGFIMNRRSIFSLTVLMAFALAGHLFAAGTPAGTDISNIAYGGYSDANGNVIADVDDPGTRIESNTVTTTVAQAYGVDVESDQTGDISRSSSVLYQMTVENTGNGDDQFDLSASTSSSGSSSFTTTIYSDGGTLGVIDGTDAVITETPVLAADEVTNILILVELDNAEGAQGEVGTTTVTATSQGDGSVDDSGTLESTVQAALITGSLAPDGTGKAPGATITYTAIVTNSNNTNSEAANDVTLTLQLPANCTWAGNVTVGGSGVPDPGAGGNVNIGNLAPGASQTVTYDVTVNAGTPAGTTIDNQVNVNYDDTQAQAYTQVDLDADDVSGGRVTVSQDYNFSTGINPASQSGDPGDVVRYLITVDNDGNGDDSYELSLFSSSQGWTWTFYIDDNDNGTWEGTEPAATNTGTIASGGSQGMWAVATIPAGTADETADASVFRTTSDSNSATSDETGTTTVTAPILTLDKSVAVVGGGDAIPGATLRYTITISNIGTGVATNVVIKDAVPANTTYIDDSMTIDGSGVTDDSDSPTDESECDGSEAIFGIGSVAARTGPGSPTEIDVTFDVRID